VRRSVESLLEDLRRLGEHERIEAKAGMGKEAIKTLVAFSNEPGMRGGWLLLGVAPKTYEVVGVPEPERVSEQLATQCSDQTLNRPIRPLITTEQVEGKNVVVVYAPEASLGDKPVYLRGLGLPRGAFRRVGAADMEGVDFDLDRYREAASGPYEATVLEDASESHLDARAVRAYLAELRTANPASELFGYPELEVVEAVGGLRRAPDGVLRPTVAGLLLFGTPLALRQFLPVASRIDYLRIDGTDWVPDAEKPFEGVIEIREPLLAAFKRINRAVLDDLTTTFSFSQSEARREEESAIPRRVVREALVNALTHRDYRQHSAIQVLRFRDRLEIRNPGHSLVEEDALGQPGSQARNPRLVQFFHDVRLAENKGTGIRVMRRQMKEANLSLPVFDSDRRRDSFATTFLFHHLLGDDDRAWLGGFAAYGLTDEQALAMAYARKRGAIRNSELRDLTGLDVLAASNQLRRLRDLGLLDAQGSGNATFYTLRPAPVTHGPKPFSGAAPEQLELLARPETQDLGPRTRDLGPETRDLEPKTQDLPEDLRRQIAALGKRPREDRLRVVIRRLMELRPYTASTLAEILGRSDVPHLVRTQLGPMVEDGTLERVHPTLNHPQQAYRARRRD
jgi:ATP-dependent DNA helicase RecG